MKKLIVLSVILLVLLATAGCQMVEPTPTPSAAEVAATSEAAVEEFVAAYPIAATAWELDYFGPQEESLPMQPDTRATVIYFWDRYAGFDGCNWFSGVYESSSEGDLRMMTPARTSNVCELGGLYEQSSTYVSALMNVTEYEMQGEQLIAYTVDDQRLLTFDPAKPVPMVGTEWDLAFWWLADSEQWYPVIPTSRTTIVLSDAGEASGIGGCNDYSVAYEGDLQIEKVMEATDTYAELPTLSFGPVSVQMAECAEPEGIMDQEQAFFTALNSVAYYFKLGSLLMLLDADGTPLTVMGAHSTSNGLQ